jgi:peroxiredoxin
MNYINITNQYEANIFEDNGTEEYSIELREDCCCDKEDIISQEWQQFEVPEDWTSEA